LLAHAAAPLLVGRCAAEDLDDQIVHAPAFGARASTQHLGRLRIERGLRAGLRCDVLLSSAGVSVGDHDHVRPVLEKLLVCGALCNDARLQEENGRWRVVAEEIARHYQLPNDARILDVGCGKAFLLYEFTRVLSEARVTGLDVSEYAIQNAKAEVRPFLQMASAPALPFRDRSFDLVISILTLHNLYAFDLWKALAEIERVGRGAKYVVVETYRNEREKVNLLYWQLTCRAFHTPAEWEWVFGRSGYTGDHSFIVFE